MASSSRTLDHQKVQPEKMPLPLEKEQTYAITHNIKSSSCLKHSRGQDLTAPIRKEKKKKIKDASNFEKTVLDNMDSSAAKKIQLLSEVKDYVNKVTIDYVGNMVTEGQQQFLKQNKHMMKSFKERLKRKNRKQHEHMIMKIERKTKPTSCNDEAIYNFRSDIMEETLTNLEIQELEQKRRDQQAIELEAEIKHVALLQEEFRLRLERIQRSIEDDFSIDFDDDDDDDYDDDDDDDDVFVREDFDIMIEANVPESIIERARSGTFPGEASTGPPAP